MVEAPNHAEDQSLRLRVQVRPQVSGDSIASLDLCVLRGEGGGDCSWCMSSVVDEVAEPQQQHLWKLVVRRQVLGGDWMGTKLAWPVTVLERCAGCWIIFRYDVVSLQPEGNWLGLIAKIERDLCLGTLVVMC